MSTIATQATPTAGSNFFSQVGEGFASGFSRVASEVLPVWASQQLLDQQVDQLAQPTFQIALAPARADAIEVTVPAGLFGPDVENQTNMMNISTTGALLLGAGVLAAIFIIKG